MTPLASISAFAFLLSWVHSMLILPQRFPDISSIVYDLISQHGTEESISHALHLVTPPNYSLSNLGFETKLQRKLTDNFVKSEVSERINLAPNPKEAARLRSIQGRGAGAWIDAIPNSQKFALKPREFQLATFVRLGLPVDSSKWISKCDCGKPLDLEGYHLLTCKCGGGPMWTHNSIVNVWSECLSHLHVNHKKEPRERYCDSEDRPDISIIDPETGCDMELDVSLSHPWCVDILPNAAREDGAAAARREEKKVEKYKSKRLPGGVILNFVPLVMEHFGRWGLEAQKFLSYLSQLCKSINIDSSPQEFRCFWRRRFAIALQRCNARVLIRKMSRAQNEEDICDNYSDQIYVV